MTLRLQLEELQDESVLVFTTFGHTYAGRVVDIQEDVVTILAPDERSEIVVHLTDVSGVRLHVEEPEEQPR